MIFYFLPALKVVEIFSHFDIIMISVGFEAMHYCFENYLSHHVAWCSGRGVTYQYCGRCSTSHRSYSYLQWSPTFQVSIRCRLLNISVSCPLPQHWVTPTGNTEESKALPHIQINCICLRTQVKISCWMLEFPCLGCVSSFWALRRRSRRVI